jgi:diguanylate cyclase (GGDEF)-like protein/PAS domain S-box-containing protein
MPGEREPVRLGLLHSLSGSMAVYERHLLDSELMAIDEINGTGGVLGRLIEPVIADSASLPHIFAKKTEELLAKGLDTFFGCWSSAARQAVRHIIEIQGGLLWYPLHYEGLEESDKIIYTGPCPNQQISPAVTWMSKQCGGRLLFIGSDSMFARGADKLIRSLIDSGGLNCTMVGSEYIHSSSDDFSPLLQETRLKKPDFIFNAVTGDMGVPFLKHYFKTGFVTGHIPMMVVGLSEVELQSVAEQAAGLFACSNYFQSLPLAANVSYINRFKKRYGLHRVVSAPIVAAYTQIHLWKQAVQEASSFTAKDVAHSSEGCAYEGPAGMITINGNHHVSQHAYVGCLRIDGQFDIRWESPDVIAPLPWAGVGDREVIGHRYDNGETPYLRAFRSGRTPEPDKEDSHMPAEDSLVGSGILRQVFEGSPAATLITDMAGIVLLANRAAENVLGFSENELKGKTFAAFSAPEIMHVGNSVLTRGIEHKEEREFAVKDGRKVYLDVAISAIQNMEGDREYLVVTIDDASARTQAEQTMRRDEARLESLLRIDQHRSRSIQDLLDFSLEEAIHLTMSKIGYIYYYDEETKLFTLNTWSKGVMKECGITEPQTTYELDKTGIWGEAVRQRKAIVLNDFQAYHPLKRGYPIGHAPLFRYLTTPVFFGNSIVAVVAVANKESNYDDSDIRQLTLLMDAVWRLTESKRNEFEISHLAAIIEHTDDAVISQTLEGIVGSWNKAAETLYGYRSHEMIGKPISRIVPADKQDELQHLLERIRQEEKAQHVETRRRAKDGHPIAVSLTVSPIRASDGSIIAISSIAHDISGKTLSEEALKKSEATLKAIVAATPVGMILTGPDGHIQWMNDRAVAITGYSAEELRELQTKVLYWGEEESNRVKSELSDGIEKEGIGTVDTQWISKSGAVRDVRLSVSAVSTGALAGAVLIVEDITQRKRIEQELAESEARYKTALDQSSDGICIIQGKRHLYVNRKWTEIFGYESDEALSMDSWDRLIHPDDIKMIKSYARLRNKGEQAPARYEYRAVNKAGATVYIDCSLSAVIYHGKPAYFLFLRDETERKTAEQAIHESEERYRVVVENSNDGVCLSRGSIIVYSNERLVEMFNFESRQELDGASMDHLAHPDDRDTVLAKIREFETRSKPSMRFEFRGITKNGSLLDVEVTAARVTYKSEDHLLTYIRDVTAKKAAEAEVQRYHKFLEDLSNTDGLTGIANRRRFDDALDQEWRRARRLNSSLSLLLIDIDFFKAYNDNYGHLAGDDCLRRVAVTLSGAIRRPADTVARYGGEEFVCLLPDTDSRGAAWIARQIHSRLRHIPIPHEYSSVSSHITVSIGLASMSPSPDEEPIELIRKADESLYQAKQAGRNRTEIYPDAISA